MFGVSISSEMSLSLQRHEPVNFVRDFKNGLRKYHISLKTFMHY